MLPTKGEYAAILNFFKIQICGASQPQSKRLLLGVYSNEKNKQQTLVSFVSWVILLSFLNLLVIRAVRDHKRLTSFWYTCKQTNQLQWPPVHSSSSATNYQVYYNRSFKNIGHVVQTSKKAFVLLSPFKVFFYVETGVEPISTWLGGGGVRRVTWETALLQLSVTMTYRPVNELVTLTLFFVVSITPRWLSKRNAVPWFQFYCWLLSEEEPVSLFLAWLLLHSSTDSADAALNDSSQTIKYVMTAKDDRWYYYFYDVVPWWTDRVGFRLRQRNGNLMPPLVSEAPPRRRPREPPFNKQTTENTTTV